ncbi:general stress protein 13 [Carnobacterium iners]|uniref:General stress protein 13 n=1 Tax=Carnobacterium iners TaxID=1073423 RepID=A0A1X7MNG4_9LACT|nr:S1 domain-containing post-transcriptional regulator GSP13 [Carnobacterium iners]SEK76626.1 general stress protein 13 [Carnobacterium iners]SMH26382.1 general stress protein 13 [Carnobacterium iners]
MDYKIGMIVKGKITGIQPYGAFVSLDKETQGLIHISECTHGYVKNLNDVLTVGDTMDIMILDIDEYTKKISLSLRVLEEQNHFQYHSKKRKYRQEKTDRDGFDTIRELMPYWIKEAKDDEARQIN